MSFRFHTLRLAAMLLAAAGAFPAPCASAAPNAAGSASAPAGAASGSTVVAPPSYRSPFDGYRKFTDQPIVSWREANDLVGRIGGWQAYARESQGAAPAGAASAASSPSSPASAPGGHSGHHAP